MRLFHGRWRREISLLAADALRGAEREAAFRHAAACAGCAADLGALRAVLATAAADEACAAEPPVDVQWLKARVASRLEGVERPAAPLGFATAMPSRRWLVPAAAAVVVAALWSSATIERTDPPRAAAASPAPTRVAVSDEALERMERTMARERAARYLDEAQDVLVTVSGAPRRCDREDPHQHVDMAEESRRSRELLARRAALDLDGSAEMAAGPVLDDVEKVLREVASLEGCARRRDVEAIHREVERERLLMRMDLTARELAG